MRRMALTSKTPRKWLAWSAAEQAHPSSSFAVSMRDSVINNTFSLTPSDDLPIATDLISQSVQRDPETLRVEAWKVAIMAGNIDLLGRLRKDGDPLRGIGKIHPFYLAASFLDGGKVCCDIITSLLSTFGSHYLFHFPHDELGHTVLDTLMIAILRSHTTVSPERVSPHFKPPHCFPGEEQDICGRWDPVSPIVCALFRQGYTRVPTAWKHAFCHSSAQAIFHSVFAILNRSDSAYANRLSGLFVRRCENCGLELKLGPVHTLVVVAFYLAHSGFPGETLFGALAVLVCMLRFGADATLKAVMSVEDLLGRAEPGGCRHKPMHASNLISAVPPELVAQWSRDCQTGWACILHVLNLAKAGGAGPPPDDDSEHESDSDEYGCRLWSSEDYDEPSRQPCGNPQIGLLWATSRSSFSRTAGSILVTLGSHDFFPWTPSKHGWKGDLRNPSLPWSKTR